MSTQILMPALSPTMEEGKLARWLVKEGDTVKSGTILAEIETDKATMEFEAVDEGKIGKILVPEGTEGVKVNAPIAVLLADGEDASSIAAAPAPKAEAQSRSAKAGSAQGRSACAAAAAPTAPKFEIAGDPSLPEGTEMVIDHGARRAARRHGRRNAPRRHRVPDGRGSRPVSGRLQDLARACWTNSASAA